jgi:hypothetical protein
MRNLLRHKWSDQSGRANINGSGTPVPATSRSWPSRPNKTRPLSSGGITLKALWTCEPSATNERCSRIPQTILDEFEPEHRRCLHGAPPIIASLIAHLTSHARRHGVRTGIRDTAITPADTRKRHLMALQ